jgi:hypothetical protein
MSWKMDRRSFLRGAAGALLPLPYLNLMEASAKSTNHGKPPLRFMTLFKPNGVHPPSWNIEGGSEHDFRMSPLMKPFARHRDDILILDQMGDFGFSAHKDSTRRFLCGHHKNQDTASIDQIIADQISPGSAHRSLELTTEGLFPNQIGCSYISYDKNGDYMPRESDPQLVFDRLFRNSLTHPEKRREMSSLLDRVNGEAKSLQRSAGYEDRQVLDQYLTVVRETEKRIEHLRGAPAPKLDFAQLKRPGETSNLDEQVTAMLDLIALALWTDSTRCITYMLGNSNSRMIFDFLGVKEQHHYLSHFFRNFSRSNIDGLLKISLWHMGKFDYLLNRLKSYRDQHGRLLDHTVVMYGSGMGHSDNHTVQRIPLVLAGGRGHIKTGRYVRYSENQELGRLHLSLAKMFGVKLDSFGDVSTPLPGLDGSRFNPHRERPFESFAKRTGDSITVQGRLRLSEDLNEANVFYIDVSDQQSVRIVVKFRDFHDFNLAYHCGTAVNISGTCADRDGQLVISKITNLRSLYGKNPGSAQG